MIGDAAVVARGDAVHAAHVHQERHQLVGTLRQVLRALELRGIVGEHFRIMRAQLARAGARGRHHVIEAFEGIHHLAGERLGNGLVAGIVGGLAAAGLEPWHVDRAGRSLQQLDRPGTLS